MAGISVATVAPRLGHVRSFIRRSTKMKRHPLCRTARLAFCAVLFTICLQFGADPVLADSPDGNPVVIRYLNDRGAVRSFEIADALGFLKEQGIRIEFEGDSSGAPESLAALASGSVDSVGVATP